MSYYARNPLQDDWTADAAADMQARVQAAEREVGRYFDRATARERAAFATAMHALLGVTGPRADRERNAAKARFQATTAPPHALFEATVECLLDTGEVSAELDEQWTALIDRERAAVGMAAE